MCRVQYRLPHYVLLTTLLLSHSLESTLVHAMSYLPTSFHFDWNSKDLLLPLPVSGQCDVIQLKWSRGASDKGPSPVAPYSMLVYSSASTTPYSIPVGGGPTFNWQVPFANLTQYQICMFDANGNTGGCQATYTVVANSSTSTPTCSSSPPAPQALLVGLTTSSGTLQDFGVVDQCTSLSVSPLGGSAPYTLTIAPASHPPFNVTSHGDFSWQVALPVGYKFFLSVSSADGLSWSNGPLTVGGQGSTSCLAPGTISKMTANKIIIGGTLGGIVAGMIAGMSGVLLTMRFRKRRQAPSDRYFGGAAYYARDRPLKAPSTIAGSLIAPSSIPLMPASSTNLGLPSSPPPPLPPLVPNRRQHGRQRSNNTLASTSPSENGTTTTTTNRTRSTRTHATHTTTTTLTSQNTHQPLLPGVTPSEAPQTKATDYPADVKVPLPTSSPDTSADIGIVLRDDAASQVSSSSRGRPLPRPLSAQSRAPTYVPRSTPLTGPDNVIDENDVPDVPPEYGRHTNDPSLNYAPNVSSGNRF